MDSKLQKRSIFFWPTFWSGAEQLFTMGFTSLILCFYEQLHPFKRYESSESAANGVSCRQPNNEQKLSSKLRESQRNGGFSVCAALPTGLTRLSWHFLPFSAVDSVQAKKKTMNNSMTTKPNSPGKQYTFAWYFDVFRTRFFHFKIYRKQKLNQN